MNKNLLEAIDSLDSFTKLEESNYELLKQNLSKEDFEWLEGVLLINYGGVSDERADEAEVEGDIELTPEELAGSKEFINNLDAGIINTEIWRQFGGEECKYDFRLKN